MTARMVPLGVLLAALLVVLGACSLVGSDEQKKTSGPVCGMFDKAVLVDFLGHDEYHITYGGEMKGPDYRADNPVDCVIKDRRTQRVRIISTLTDVTTPAKLAQLRRTLTRGFKALPNCTRPPAVKRLGEGYACVDKDTLQVAVILSGEPRRFVRMSLTGSEGEAPSVDQAVTLIEELNANVEDYDERH